MPRKKNDMRQCYRCFGFDHTGRCSEPHLTGSGLCKAKTYDDLVCVNCQGNRIIRAAEYTSSGLKAVNQESTGPVMREGYSQPTRTINCATGQQGTRLDRNSSYQHRSSPLNTDHQQVRVLTYYINEWQIQNNHSIMMAHYHRL